MRDARSRCIGTERNGWGRRQHPAGLTSARRWAHDDRVLDLLRSAWDESPPAQPIESLTDREEQVLVAVARGRTNSEIAEELFITLSTVKTHIASVMAKLGARNRVEIAIWAYETHRVDRSAS